MILSNGEFDQEKLEKMYVAMDKYYRLTNTKLRMGQFLMNTLEPHATNPTIFYEQNDAKSVVMFMETYCLKS